MATAIAVTPGNDLFVGIPGGILRSTDGNGTFAAVALASPAPLVTAIVVSSTYEQDGYVWAGTLEDGVFRSDDCGATWVAWNFGLLDHNVFCLAISSDQILYAGVESGIFCSKNLGRSWQEVTFPMMLGPVLSLTVSQGVFLAGTEQHGLYRSGDGGETWDRIFSDATGSMNAILVTPEQRIVACADDQLGISRDGGETWRILQVPIEPDASFVAVAALPSSVLLLGVSDGQILRYILPT
jgi:photosystem II stability/assembly factor-like uncharacterized protein